MWWLLLACAGTPPAPIPDACALMATPAPGPLEARRAGETDPLTIARIHVEEARRSGDPGFYSLAQVAVDCAAIRTPDDLDAKRLGAHLGIQFHRFAEVEAAALELTARPDAGWLDHALLGDALMEQGKLDAAAVAYQRAADLRPGLAVYDRISWLRWLWGDVDGALEMATLAASSGSALDPEPWAWTLTRLGWLHAIRGEPAPEIEEALQLVPDYLPARFARGRIRLHAGDREGAAADLRAAGPTVEAVRALAEIEPADIEAVRSQDPRGYATWLADRDPDAALPILEEELAVRQDAVTRIAHAWAVHRSGRDGSAEARAAVATGIAEPRALLHAGLILGDRTLVDRALASGPGLLPSERALATP